MSILIIDFFLLRFIIHLFNDLKEYSAIKIGFPVLRISRLLDNEDSPFIFLENYFHSQITLKVGEVFSQLLYYNYEIDCNDNLNFLNEKKTDSLGNN